MASDLNKNQGKEKLQLGSNDGDVCMSKTAKFGKMVRVELDVNKDKRIMKIQITGDFFLHPEEKIEELESLLVGVDIKDKQEIQRKIQNTLQDCKVYGFELDSLVDMVHSFSEELESNK